MSQWAYVWIAYGVTIAVIAGLSAWCWLTMRSTEARAKSLKGRKR